jgi:hypothetical protein
MKKLFSTYFWGDLIYNIKCFFKPRQEWLTDVIPDTHCDKVELIPTILFKCLEHYVEVEMKNDWTHDIGYTYEEELALGYVTQEYVDRVMKVDEDLLVAYNWIKEGRVALKQKIDDAYPAGKITSDMFTKREGGNYSMNPIPEKESDCYAEVTRLEAILSKKDIETMQIIVKYHQFLWT